MALAWKEVSEKPEFKALSLDDQFAARQQYFREVVMPKVEVSERAEAFRQFNDFADSLMPKAQPLPPEETKPGLAKDLLYGAAKGAGQVVQAAGWLTGSDTVEELGRNATDYWSNLQSDKMKGQLSAVEQADGFWNTLVALKDNPSAFADMVVGSLPMMVPGMAVGSLGARGIAAFAGNAARNAAMKAGASEVIANQAGSLAAQKSIEAGGAKWFAMAANVLGEGAVSGGATGSNVEQFALDHGATETEAKDAARWAAMKAGASTALVAGIGAKFETEALLGKLTDKGFKGAAKNIGKESLEEGLQNPAEEYFGYEGRAKFDPNQKYDFGGSLATGLATGGMMGGGFHAAGRVANMLAGEQSDPIADISSATTTDDAIVAASSAINAPINSTLPRDMANGGLDISGTSQRNQDAIFRESLNQQGQERQADINDLDAFIEQERLSVQAMRQALIDGQATRRDAINSTFTGSSDTLALPSPQDPTGTLRVTPEGAAIPETRQQRLELERARRGYRPSGNIDERGINALHPTATLPVQQRQQPPEKPDSGRLQMQGVQDGIQAGPAAIVQGGAEAQAHTAGDVPVNKWVGIDSEADSAMREGMLRRVAIHARDDEDLNGVLDRLPDPLSQEPYAGETSRISFSVMNNPSAQPGTKARAKKIYEGATRGTTNTATTMETPAGQHGANTRGATPVEKGDVPVARPGTTQPAPLPTDTSAPVIASPAAQPGVILHKNGKPFKSKGDAKLALIGKHKALKDTHHIVKMGEGFAIAEKPAPAPRKPAKPVSVDTHKHTLLQAIAIKGVDASDPLANDLRKSLGLSDGKNMQVHVPGRPPMWIFRKGGMRLDAIAGDLSQSGERYLDAHDRQEMLDKLFDNPDHMTPEGAMAKAQREYETEQAEQQATNKEKLESTIAAQDMEDATIDAELEWILANGRIMTEEEADAFSSEYVANMENEHDQQRAAEAAASNDAGGVEAVRPAGNQEAGGETFGLEGQTNEQIIQREQEAEAARQAEAIAAAEATRLANKAAEEQRQKDNATNGNAADSFSMTPTEPVDKRKQNAIDKAKAKTELAGQTDLLSQQSAAPTSENKRPTAIESIKQSDTKPEQPAKTAATKENNHVAVDDIPPSLKISGRNTKGKVVQINARKAMLAANQKVDKYKALLRCMG